MKKNPYNLTITNHRTAFKSFLCLVFKELDSAAASVFEVCLGAFTEYTPPPNRLVKIGVGSRPPLDL